MAVRVFRGIPCAAAPAGAARFAAPTPVDGQPGAGIQWPGPTQWRDLRGGGTVRSG
jgi:para-nitrobenzyl esterase